MRLLREAFNLLLNGEFVGFYLKIIKLYYVMFFESDDIFSFMFNVVFTSEVINRGYIECYREILHYIVR